MPHRDRATVAAWIDEFNGGWHPIATTVDVLEQREADGSDRGLVVVRLRTAPTVTYLHTVDDEHPVWVATFEARDHDIHLDSTELTQLADDFAVLANLCAFLQQKTDAHAASSR